MPLTQLSPQEAVQLDTTLLVNEPLPANLAYERQGTNTADGALSKHLRFSDSNN